MDIKQYQAIMLDKRNKQMELIDDALKSETAIAMIIPTENPSHLPAIVVSTMRPVNSSASKAKAPNSTAPKRKSTAVPLKPQPTAVPQKPQPTAVPQKPQPTAVPPKQQPTVKQYVVKVPTVKAKPKPTKTTRRSRAS